jgi:hypothetical protein
MHARNHRENLVLGGPLRLQVEAVQSAIDFAVVQQATQNPQDPLAYPRRVSEARLDRRISHT